MPSELENGLCADEVSDWGHSGGVGWIRAANVSVLVVTQRGVVCSLYASGWLGVISF